MHPHIYAELKHSGVTLLSIKDACARLGCGRSKFYDLAAHDLIKVHKLGSSSKVRSDELDAFIQGLPTLVSSSDAAQ